MKNLFRVQKHVRDTCIISITKMSIRLDPPSKTRRDKYKGTTKYVFYPSLHRSFPHLLAFPPPLSSPLPIHIHPCLHVTLDKLRPALGILLGQTLQILIVATDLP